MSEQSEVDKLKKRLKEYKKLINELQEENTMLWEYLEEIKEQEKQLMSEIGIAIDDYITKNMKPIGDA